jgi:hypothetical protein
MELTLKVPTALKVQQQPPDEKPKTEAELAAEDKAARAADDDANKQALMQRLDGAASTLVTATAVVVALLTALGLTGDRLAVILNSSESKALVLGAVGCAVGAVICGTAAVALSVEQLWLEKTLLGLGTFLFAGSLVLAVLAASTSFTEDGRPTITEVSVADAGGTGAVLSFSVRSDGVAQDAALRVVAIWVRNSDVEDQRLPFYSTVLRPSATGVIQQTATVYLSRPTADTYVRIQAIRMRDPEKTDEENAQAQEAIIETDAETQCSAQTDQKTAPACADILVPAAGPPPA